MSMKTAIAQLRPGLTGSAEITVEERHTARSMGSGRMDVLATPAMIALMEAAAQKAVDGLLPPGHQTIGTRLDVQHYGATPIGMRAIASAELTGIDGRTLTFHIVVHDDKEKIAEGSHERTIISVASFNRLLQIKMKRGENSHPDKTS